jgi:hypothetical protein
VDGRHVDDRTRAAAGGTGEAARREVCRQQARVDAGSPLHGVGIHERDVVADAREVDEQVALGEPGADLAEEALDGALVRGIDRHVIRRCRLDGGMAREDDRVCPRGVEGESDVRAETARAADDDRKRPGEALHQANSSSTLRAPLPGLVSVENASSAARGWKR